MPRYPLWKLPVFRFSGFCGLTIRHEGFSGNSWFQEIYAVNFHKFFNFHAVLRLFLKISGIFNHFRKFCRVPLSCLNNSLVLGTLIVVNWKLKLKYNSDITLNLWHHPLNMTSSCHSWGHNLPYRTKLRRTRISSDKIFCQTKFTKYRVLEMQEEPVFWAFKSPILFCLRQLCEIISWDKISSPSQNFVTFVRQNFVR